MMRQNDHSRGALNGDGRRASPCHELRHDTVVHESVIKHGNSEGGLLPVLQDVQAEYGYLPSNSIGAAADALGKSDAQVYGVASFFSMLSIQPHRGEALHLCDGPVCSLAGCRQVQSALKDELPGEWTIEQTGCLGLCDRAPAALVKDEACGPLNVRAVADLVSGWRGESVSYAQSMSGELRIAMARVGQIDPASIDSAIQSGAYETLGDTLKRLPEDILDTLERSGLRGSGGAGFPTGRKWRMVAEEKTTPKYVVCNADESEPGTFKDRVLMEGDPHLVVEGMALAAYAVGARHGIIYVRGEYEQSAQLLEKAITDAREHGWLGKDIQGSPFSFDIEVHRGAGAYICGEETALLESLEGRRGEPRIRPPYPTTHGYLGCPTVVNNVETLCQVPEIVKRGASWYRSMGTPSSPGTKIFMVTGHINRPGVFEVPLGITLREVIDGFGDGMRPGSKFKMALTGGAAGTLVPRKLLDVPIDFSSHQAGVAMGSGAVIVMDESVSAVELLSWLLHFFEVESCGKCTPCREGTRQARMILERLQNGGGRVGDCDQLVRLAKMLGSTSFCGLGKSVASPIESSMQHFLSDFHEQGAS